MEIFEELTNEQLLEVKGGGFHIINGEVIYINTSDGGGSGGNAHDPNDVIQ